jgi:hypothetical protein
MLSIIASKKCRNLSLFDDRRPGPIPRSESHALLPIIHAAAYEEMLIDAARLVVFGFAITH